MFAVAIVFTRLNVRPKVLNINRNEPLFYSYSILINECSGIRNSINDPYAAKLCVPDVIKDMNIKVFNLMSRINGTRLIYVNVDYMQVFVKIKKHWNKGKNRCECKGLIHKDTCDKGFI